MGKYVIPGKKTKAFPNHMFAFLCVLEIKSKSGLISILILTVWNARACVSQ